MKHCLACDLCQYQGFRGWVRIRWRFEHLYTTPTTFEFGGLSFFHLFGCGADGAFGHNDGRILSQDHVHRAQSCSARIRSHQIACMLGWPSRGRGSGDDLPISLFKLVLSSGSANGCEDPFGVSLKLAEEDLFKGLAPIPNSGSQPSQPFFVNPLYSIFSSHWDLFLHGKGLVRMASSRLMPESIRVTTSFLFWRWGLGIGRGLVSKILVREACVVEVCLFVLLFDLSSFRQGKQIRNSVIKDSCGDEQQNQRTKESRMTLLKKLMTSN